MTSTTLAYPICGTYARADYELVGIASQPAGVKEYAVLRCREHGVEFAEAMPLPAAHADVQRSLDGLYGGLLDEKHDPRAFVSSPKWSLAHYRNERWWLRLAATVAVYSLFWLSRLTRKPNDMFVYTRVGGFSGSGAETVETKRITGL